MWIEHWFEKPWERVRLPSVPPMRVDQLHSLPDGAIIEQYFHPPKWNGDDEGSWFFEKLDENRLLFLENHRGTEYSKIEYHINGITTEDVEFIYHGIRRDW